MAQFLWPPAFVEEPLLLPEAVTYYHDGLLSAHNCDFLADPHFQRAYAAGKATGSWWDHDLEWRAHVICWAAQRGLALGGDYVECGVHRGGFSRMLADYVGLDRHLDRKLYLIDTYRGVPKEFRSEGQEDVLESLYTDSYRDVLRTFAPFPNAKVVRGRIPDVLPEVRPEQVCYLSIDLNCVEPSIAAADHFWPLMVPGAAMILDDYGFSGFFDQKVAFDGWALRSGVEILSLPTGQGLVLKPPAGAS
ncbi:MAG TPA: TylF/MycF/NovP-related O-methyltransferase [Allosphingosinicella sp.]